jgi:hypothetical protein
MDHTYTFGPADDAAASYKFSRSARRSYVGILGDLGVLRDVTGADASRMLGKVKNAYEKFKVCPDDGGVHLVALEVDNTIELAHVAEALYVARVRDVH